jgi:hypothetical protein
MRCAFQNVTSVFDNLYTFEFGKSSLSLSAGFLLSPSQSRHGPLDFILVQIERCVLSLKTQARPADQS